MTVKIEAYRVEPETSHKCATCGAGEMWDIVGPDDTALGTTYGSKEEAEDICEDLNIAFEKGMRQAANELLGESLGDS